MRFAFSQPNFGDFADVRELCALAQEAEDAGWDGFFLWDHINVTSFIAGGATPILDPWVALAAIAAATSRIRIGTMITPLPRRRPWKLAREAVTLDHLSGGRVTLGVGLGFPPDREYAALGEDADDRVRGRKLDESLRILDGLWSGQPFSFDGEHYRIAETTFLPRPLQQPRIPVWVAGVWPLRAPMRRAARYDGAFPIATTGDDFRFLTPDEIAAVRDLVRRDRGSVEGFDIATALPPPGIDGRRVVDYESAGLTWWVETEFTPAELRARMRDGPSR